MINVTTLPLSSSSRGNILGSADGLVANPSDALLHTGNLPVPGPLGGPMAQAGASFSTIGGGVLPPLESVANEAILDFHSAIEGASHDLGLPGSLHGLTNLGETVGLGRLGGSNLLTDVIKAPSNALSGDVTNVAHVPADVSAIAGAAQVMANGVVADVVAGQIIPGVLNNSPQAVSDIASFPAATVANQAINAIHTVLESTLDPIMPNTVHGVTGLGNTIGLGEIGGSNLLTHVLQTPGALVAGSTIPLSHVPQNAAEIVESAGHVVTAVGQDVAGSYLTNAISNAIANGSSAGTVLGSGGLGSASGGLGLAVGGIGSTVTGVLSGSESGSSGSHDLISVSVGPQTPVEGIGLNILSNSADHPSHLLGVHAITVPDAVPTLTNVSVLPDAAHLPSLAGAEGAGSAGSLASIAPAGLGSAVTSVLPGSHGGSHDLVTAAMGPQTSPGVLELNALSTTGNNPAHVIDVHAITVPDAVPAIASVSVLPETLHLTGITGVGGGDALAGVLAPLMDASQAAPCHGGFVGVGSEAAHMDVAALTHLEPLSSLGHAVHLA